MASHDLLPCPFCKSAKVFLANVPVGIVIPNVACMNCGTRGPTPERKPGTVPGDPEAAEAIRLWNTRAVETELREALKLCADMLEATAVQLRSWGPEPVVNVSYGIEKARAALSNTGAST